MSEIRPTLERIERRVPMPEPAMERMLRRRERKQRNERIAAAALGLGIAVAGVVGAVVTLRVAAGTRPASEGSGAAAATESGGFVLPTVAIWTAIVVLGLTVLAAVRLRARFVDVDVERQGREPGEAAASARRPAATPGAAPGKGGSEMYSQPKTATGVPQAEMPQIRFDDGRLRRTNRWLVGAVVVLAVAVVALGSLVLVDLTGGEEAAVPTPDPRAATIDALAAAWSGTDSGALAEFYADNAVFITENGAVYEGRDAIVGLEESMDNLQVARVSGVIGQRKFAAAVMRLENAYGHAYVLTLWKFNPEGKILSQHNFYGGS